ncbi:shufflon system plasmid conjugative transfer pilus tip adhesin PilV [Arsenophonus sp. ENCA]|uniref:shufflon system plasmid conjugative transfer pilus tip adhesin PilV n=1 Tax=Arsenophonus sp. ENCA TaxID=1987579 RepID=UPI0025B8AE88|nr:shufflon system plasmid conjugative transfer pilus tip adhesin PilV [Arsenophonus sp. ENCA]
MNDNDWIRSVNNKGIYTGGQLKGGTVRADGRLSTDEFLHLGEKNAVQPGWGCSPNGLVGRTPEGALLSCQNGRWTSGASLQQRECKQMGNWGGRDFREYRCPVGWYAAGLKFVGHQHEESAYVITCCH